MEEPDLSGEVAWAYEAEGGCGGGRVRRRLSDWEGHIRSVLDAAVKQLETGMQAFERALELLHDPRKLYLKLRLKLRSCGR